MLLPCEPLPTSAFVSMLGDVGKDYEADIFERLAAAIPGSIVVDEGLSRSEREAATLGAMDDEVPLVIGGRLPVDRMALRAGEPDLLVRSDVLAEGLANGGYLPVDVKHHKTLDLTTKEDPDGVLLSELDTLFVAPAELDLAFDARWLRNDLLQVAHYQRLLESWGAPLGSGAGAASWAARSGSSGTTSTCPSGSPPSTSRIRRIVRCRPRSSTTSSSPIASP